MPDSRAAAASPAKSHVPPSPLHVVRPRRLVRRSPLHLGRACPSAGGFWKKHKINRCSNITKNSRNVAPRQLFDYL
eukprot:2506431-Pyramimonas_sp.AAC.1